MHYQSVPAEFIGQARAFRARMGADDAVVGQTIKNIAAPLEARRKRKPTFRPETLIDAERAFRLPSAGRLTLKIGAEAARRLEEANKLLEEVSNMLGDVRRELLGSGNRAQ